MSRKALKIISLAVCCMMALTLLAGCGSNSKVSGNTVNTAEATTVTTTAGTAEATAAPAKQEPVTIEWLGYNTNAQPDPECEVIKQQEEWYNIKFNFWFVDNQQWDQALGVKLASGDMPDVLKIKNTAMVAQYVKQGVLAPITEDMKKKIPLIMKNIEENGGIDQTLDAMYDGQLYAIKQVTVNGGYSWAVVWRKDWLKNVGITKIPETLTEFEDALYKFRNNDPDQNGKKDTYGMSNTSLSIVFGAYGQIPLGNFTGKGTQTLRWTKKDGKYVIAAIQPEMKDALVLLQKWHKDGVIDPEFITGENTGGYWALTQAFSNGKIGVTSGSLLYHWIPPLAPGLGGAACYKDFVQVNPTATFGETIDMGKAPTGPYGKSGTYKDGSILTAGVGFTTKMVKDPRKVDAVLNMMNTISTDYDKYVYGNYGVKDKHYVMDPVNGVTITKEYTGDAAVQIKEGFAITTICAMNIDFAKKMLPGRYNFMDKYGGIGYADYITPATDASSKYLEDLKRMATEAYIKIISCDVPVEYFDEFVKTFNERGGAELEKQTNEIAAKLIGK